MKLLQKAIERDGQGSVSVIPEEKEDLWHVYNLIAEGDKITATTVRRVQRETSTGSANSERVRVTLTVTVEQIQFEPNAEVIRISGRNVSENQHVKMGAYHTLELELNRKFTLSKTYWDSIALERVENACDPGARADVAAILMQEGLANVCLITNSMTIVRARIEQPVPRKRKGSVSTHEKGLMKFFENILQAILRHLNFDVIKCLVIASPGFTKDQFFDFLNEEMVRRDLRVLIENKSKFVLCHSSSAHKTALKEIFANPGITVKLQDTKAAGEVKTLNDFFETLNHSPDRAVYGIAHVNYATERLAIQTLLISDKLFRSNDIGKRKAYVHLVETVRENGGDVKIFSSLHSSGEQLDQLSGIAAILRFPLPGLDDIPMDEEEAEQAADDGHGEEPVDAS